MTYKEVISLFIAKYNKLSFGKQVNKVTPESALLDISIALNTINNKYYLAQKNVTLTIQSGADKVLYSDITPNQLPADVMFITNIALNNISGTVLNPCSISNLRGYVKSAGVPSKFCLYLNNTGKILELDTYASETYSATMLYVPKIDIYFGSGGDNRLTSWSDLDFTKSGYGGSLPIDDNYINVVIERALCETFPERFELAQALLKEIMQTKPIIFDGRLVDYWDNQTITPIIGQDTGRT